MKKIIAIGLLTVCAAVLFALEDKIEPISQDWGPESLENEITQGLFSNEIDEAFLPNADFGSYEQQFIFAGLANPWKAKDAIKPRDDKKMETRFGYYRPGKLPMSFYGQFKDATTVNNNISKSGTIKRWGDDQHADLLSTQKISYNKVPLFNKYNGTLRFLMAFGEEKRLVTGFYFNISADDSAFNPEHNIKSDFTDHKDSNKSVKVNAMNVASTKDGTTGAYSNSLSSTWSSTTGVAAMEGAGQFTNKFTIGVPLAFKTGDLAHVAKFELHADLKNKNAWLEQKKNKENVKFKSTGYDSTVTLGGSYEVEIPAKDREEDAWTVGGGLGFEFKNNELKYEFKADKDAANNEDVKVKYNKTQTPGCNFTLTAEGGRSFVFPSPQKTVIFKIKPTVGIGLKTGIGAAYNPKIDATYSNKAIGSHTYKQTVKGQGHNNTTAFQTSLSVPMGLKIMPEGWKFGLLLGARLETRWTVEATFDRSNNNKVTTTTTVDSTTKTENKYPANAYDSRPSVTKNKLDIEEEHYIGFTIPFEGGARFDVAISGNNLTELNNFKIQAFIPLGVPKSK